MSFSIRASFNPERLYIASKVAGDKSWIIWGGKVLFNIDKIDNFWFGIMKAPPSN